VRVIIGAVMGATSLCATEALAEEADGPVQLSLSYVADVTGVFDGGITQRGAFLDNLDIVVDADLERLWGWNGTSAHLDVLNNSGGIPNDYAGTLQGVDNIEVSKQKLRLFEAWVEKAWGASSVRAGLYDLNSEFYANDSAGYLIAPAFGIGSEFAATGPNGPSIFPSTSLAVRYHHDFGGDWFARATVMNAHAGVPGDPDGIDLEFDDGALLVAEGGVEGDRKLALGVWRYTEDQDDIREIDINGDPVDATAHGAYLVYEQPFNDPYGFRAAHGFIRAGISDGDTTPFEGGWQAGVLVERVFEIRPDSVVSLGVNQGFLSDGYRHNQIDAGSSMLPSEVQVELTYSDKIGWLTVQPDLQWVHNPGGDRGIDDAWVGALRFAVEL